MPDIGSSSFVVSRGLWTRNTGDGRQGKPNIPTMKSLTPTSFYSAKWPPLNAPSLILRSKISTNLHRTPLDNGLILNVAGRQRWLTCMFSMAFKSFAAMPNRLIWYYMPIWFYQVFVFIWRYKSFRYCWLVRHALHRGRDAWYVIYQFVSHGCPHKSTEGVFESFLTGKLCEALRWHNTWQRFSWLLWFLLLLFVIPSSFVVYTTVIISVHLQMFIFVCLYL